MSILYTPSVVERQIHFNYETRFNDEWRNSNLETGWRYKPRHGGEDEGSFVNL